jgi:hypothetical protein
MSVIVFVGVYAIGDPVEILISPDADQIERESAVRALGLDLPLWQQYLVFLDQCGAGRSRSLPSCSTNRRSNLILQRMPATLELAFGATFGCRSSSACRWASMPGLRPNSRALQGDHGGVHPRLLAAHLLGRADADHGVRRAARLATLHGPRRDMLGPWLRRDDLVQLRHAMVVPDG